MNFQSSISQVRDRGWKVQPLGKVSLGQLRAARGLTTVWRAVRISFRPMDQVLGGRCDTAIRLNTLATQKVVAPSAGRG